MMPVQSIPLPDRPTASEVQFELRLSGTCFWCPENMSNPEPSYGVSVWPEPDIEIVPSLVPWICRTWTGAGEPHWAGSRRSSPWLPM